MKKIIVAVLVLGAIAVGSLLALRRNDEWNVMADDDDDM